MPTNPSHLLSTPKGDVLLAQARRPFAFASPFGGEDFAVMLIVAASDISSDEQAQLSDALVAQGCRYAVCWGHACSTWDDSVDEAILSTHPERTPSNDRYVMTTWHDDESLEEAAWFFLWNTEYDDYVPRRFLALILGGNPKLFEEAAQALRKAAADHDPA